MSCSKIAKFYTIFVGNPGVGKSTLLSSFPNAPKFKSGLSWGGGLTKILQLAEISATEVIGDTPGLSDMGMRKDAAKEIEKGLKKNGHYRLVFVITLEAGRVRPDDATTVRLILEAVDAAIPFGILINKLEEEAFEELCDNQEAQRLVMTGILAGIEPKRSTSYFHAVKLEPRLSGKSNVTPPTEVSNGLLEWLNKVPYMEVKSAQVGEINAETFDEAKEKAQARIQELENDKAEVEKRFKELIEKEKKEALERERALVERTEAQIREMKRKNEEDKKRFGQEREDAKKREAEMRAEMEKDRQALRNQIAALQRPPPRGGGGWCAVM